MEEKPDFIIIPLLTFKEDIENVEYTGESVDISELEEVTKKSIIEQVFRLFQME